MKSEAVQEKYTVGIWAYFMAKNSYKDLTAFFIPPKYVDHKIMKEKNIPQWLFELPPEKQGQSNPSGSLFLP